MPTYRNSKMSRWPRWFSGVVTLLVAISTSGYSWESSYQRIISKASSVTTSTTNFNNNLGAGDTDVQKALDTLDNMTGVGGGDSVSVAGVAATDANFLEGLGIDLTLNTGASPDEITVAFDPAEIGAVTWLDNADRAWTFDVAGAGTNPVLSFASGVMNLSVGAYQESGIGVPNLDELDASSELAAIIDDETGSGVIVFGTSPTITTSLSQDGDAADAGYLRLQNGANIAWEASPAGTDYTLGVDSSEILQASGAFNAAGTVTGSNLSGTNTGDQTITLTGDVTGSGTGSFATTIANDSVSLTTKTTGNYAAGDAEAGNALTGDSATAFFSAGTMELARGGTGASLADPNAHRFTFWDDTDNAMVFALLGTNLSYDAATNTVNSTSGSTTFDAIGDAAGNGDVAMAETVQSLSWDSAATAAAYDAVTFQFTHDSTTDSNTQRGVVIERLATSGTAAFETLLQVQNNDTDGAVTTGIEVLSAAGVITTGVDASDAEIATGLALGENDVTVNAKTISAAEFGRLDGVAGAIYYAGGTDVAVGDGGTGVSSWTANSLVYASGSATLASLGAATNGQIPIGSTSAAPVLATITGVANETDVTNGAGTITIGLVDPLVVAKGGTGIASGTSGGVPYFSGSTTIASSAALASTYIVTGGGAGAAPVTGVASVAFGAGTGADQTITFDSNAATDMAFKWDNTNTRADLNKALNVSGGSNARVTFDTGDFLDYNTSTNLFDFQIGSTSALALDATTLTVNGAVKTIFTASSTQSVTAATYTILANATRIVLDPNADYTMTSAPTIADGVAGQLVYIMAANGETNTVTVQDQDTLASSNLQLGATTRAISGKDVLTLIFDGTDWVEQAYANN